MNGALCVGLYKYIYKVLTRLCADLQDGIDIEHVNSVGVFLSYKATRGLHMAKNLFFAKYGGSIVEARLRCYTK